MRRELPLLKLDLEVLPEAGAAELVCTGLGIGRILQRI